MISFLICSTTSVLLSCKRYSILIYLMIQSLSDFNLFPLSERSCSNFGIRNSARRVNMRAWRGFKIGWTMTTTTTMKMMMITIWTYIEIYDLLCDLHRGDNLKMCQNVLFIQLFSNKDQEKDLIKTLMMKSQKIWQFPTQYVFRSNSKSDEFFCQSLSI